MSRISLAKLLAIIAPILLLALTAQARPEYLALYAADPDARPELRAQCSVCHVNPAGGGQRNAFGRAFAAAGFQITPDLKTRFPDRFLQRGAPEAKPPVTFVKDSDSQAVVEINGKRFLIDTKARTVSEVAAEPKPSEPVAAAPAPQPLPSTQEENVYQPADVRLINLPTAMPIPRGSLWVDFTHRFPDDVTNAAGLFGLDSFAVPSFGFSYGITDRLHVGAYRSPSSVGRPILVYAGVSLLDEREGHPFTAMARVGVEGRDNFQRNFTTSLELTAARSITRHAQIYAVPTLSLSNRRLQAFGNPARNLPGETTFALGLGGALNVRPTVALMAEANYRLNEEGRFGVTRPNFGFGIQKVSATRRHAFSLTFSNGLGTTMAQRSSTRAAIFGPGVDESFKGLTIGFNLTRRLF
jgi:hypothetical protein